MEKVPRTLQAKTKTTRSFLVSFSLFKTNSMYTLYYCNQVRELDLEHLFDAVVVSGDFKFEKPQPEIFHQVCTLLRVEPFECLMVGDSLETGQFALLGLDLIFTFTQFNLIFFHFIIALNCFRH